MRHSTRGWTSRGAGCVLAVAVAACRAATASGQTVQGTIVDDEDDRPVPTALVRMVDGEGSQVAVTAADSVGRYRIDAPEPGIYRLQAERIGYQAMETPPLEMGQADGVYVVELAMRPAPVPIEGLEVTDREVDRRVRLLTGVAPRAMRWGPIRGTALQRHVEAAHDLTAVVRWGNYPGIEVRESRDGPCYLVRRYGCLPVYLDGFALTPEAFDLVPLDMLHTIFLVGPNESVNYPRGAVLAYTYGWLR